MLTAYPTEHPEHEITDSYDRVWVPGSNPRRRYARGRHGGIDLRGGGNILAANPGIVRLRSFGVAFGKQVSVVAQDGGASFYAHLAHVAVSEGVRVDAGRTLGIMGSTGQSTGVHLHFEYRLRWGDWTTIINPYGELQRLREGQVTEEEIQRIVRLVIQGIAQYHSGSNPGTHTPAQWDAVKAYTNKAVKEAIGLGGGLTAAQVKQLVKDALKEGTA